ncbi:Sucrase/ferredoxin-like family protein [Perilla frutescens var. hirtella]|uniref:Sucrase/ferredoxin-like family protein n=1 Tax=Perilla frutescens var. hirtella TaxID=608512 RepID=A0AAD4IX14_PERFH|nr:Sucrase/ferredoxin-like family protein [Perilla frutescens var. frutescens]KAH6786290.1 Sucrase/ferredoxin-like family protein [Perilla frutescens var. hirtella]KAH6822726.1 Sucrase/ferredoxin-like family protein [Perilla frutescens var. hirtella]
MSNPVMAAGNRDDPLMLLSGQYPSSSSSPIAVSEGDSYLLDGPQIGSASGSFQNDGVLGGTYDAGFINESDYGFARPDFRQGPLVGTVELYDRHVFLCYKNPQVWPPRIEAAEFDRLPRLLAAALAARNPHMQRQTRLTICEGHDGTETSNGDVLIFPDMIRYRRLTHFDVDTFVEEVLVKNGEWLPGSPEPLRGWYIFVCCHGSRDRRCGVCGPSVISKFKTEIESRGLQGKVSISPCSHIGGHKYAGNMIIFGRNMNNKVTGHWYGYVMPEDVPLLLEQHIDKGEIVDFLWRGQMGLSEEDQKKTQELRFRVHCESNIDRSIKDSTQTNEECGRICASQSGGTGCCQVNGDFSCCQNPVLQEKREDPQVAANFATEMKKSSKKPVSRNNSGKGIGPRKVCSMPTWYESWEREDTYAALAVIMATVSVAFTYKCYRQLC